MEKLKSYWREIAIIVLVLIGTLYFVFNKKKDISKTEAEIANEKVIETVRKLSEAQEEYNTILNEKKAKLEAEAAEIQKMEEAVSIKIEDSKTTTAKLTSTKDALKAKYKVGSPYDSSKLDKLLFEFSNKKKNN
jgi:hypothetical protein